MKRIPQSFLLTLLCLCLQLPTLQGAVTDSNLSTVIPIIKNKCLSCHSTENASTTKLNHSNTLGWVNSSLVVPGDSSKSRLVTVFTTNTPKAMTSIKLSNEELKTLKDWINQIKLTCTPANSKIITTKSDSCGCPSGYDEIRNANGALSECRKVEVISCKVNLSQIDTSRPDKCGCITGYVEKRNEKKELLSCLSPTYTFDAELKRYNRCYAQFTRAAVSANDPRMALIKAKKMTGVQACMDLLKKANLNSSGRIQSSSSGEHDLEGMQILSTFQKFHMSWLSNHNWADVAENLNAFYRGTYDLFYSGEPALLMTNALFNPGVPYSSVMTSENAYEAIRLNPSNNVFARSAFSKYEYFGSKKERLNWTPAERIEVGNIIGIKQMNSDHVPYLAEINKTDIEYKLPSGGGVLGSNSFFMLNQGRNLHARPNGGTATYRRWSKYVYKDILCREIPVIRSSDVVFLKAKLPASDLTFRNGLSCLQCHFSIDGLAGAVRNRTVTRTGIDKQDVTLNAVHGLIPYSFPITEAAEKNLESSDNDSNFYKRPPLANFIFRSYDGVFYNEQYEGTEELGKAMSELDDPYICAASRYYRFLTGVNVEIRDYNDSMSSLTDTADEIKYRNLVIQLGKNLKKHQNLNKMIEEIISSPLYLTPGKVE